MRVPLLGRRGVSVRSRKYGVCKPRSETMFVSEGMLELAFGMLRAKKERHSEGSAPCVGELYAGSALASGSIIRLNR